MIEKINFHDYPNCLRLSNGTVEAVVSTDFGPRILFYGPAGGENILGLHPHARVETAIGEWRPYGGHRLWMAPENMPLSYAPDNAAVEVFEEDALSARFVSPAEEAAKIQKEIRLSLSETGSDIRIEHRITNRGDREIELAAWALTIMRAGGAAVVPHEAFKPYGPETLLPVRTMTLWSYTDFTDPRWQFDKRLIRLRVDENLPDPQKFGVLNRRGWAAYEWENLLFVKRFEFVDGARFPDMNSNTEIYTAGGFVEVETLSPLVALAPGESVVHTETWQLFENTKVEEWLEKEDR
jgi:hypothetical protein